MSRQIDFLQKSFSKCWIWDEKFRYRLPAFFENFERHVHRYIDAHDVVTIDLLVEIVSAVHNKEVLSNSNEKKMYDAFRGYLESTIVSSASSPSDRNTSSIVSGHRTFPGSFEAGKRR